MTMINCLGRVILGRWFEMKTRSRAISPVLAAMVLAVAAGQASAADPALSELGQGINAYNVRDFRGAVAHLRAARSVTRLSDYVAYHLAYSQTLTGDNQGALEALTAYRANPIAGSPFTGKISLLYARVLLDRHESAASTSALNVLQTDYKLLPQPDGDFALALAYEAQGDQQHASLSYARVYYAYPDTDLAAQSWTAMERLRIALAQDFPQPPPRQRLERAEKWLAAKDYTRARQEYSALADSLNDPEKDDAKVGIGAANYLAGDSSAFRYLKALQVARPEAEAQRLYYVSEAARKAGDDTEMMDAVNQLRERYPRSPWLLKALVTAGNRYLLTNDHDKYAPLFKAASDSFPSDSSTAYCHWKITWDAYMGDKPDRVTLLKEQIERYPADSRASTALYFLGRIAESGADYAEARAWYDRLSAQFPHYFYGVLGRQRIREKVASATADANVKQWLAGIAWPSRRDFSATEPNGPTQQRIERGRLLLAAGLPDAAETELRFGAKTDNEQPQVLALELARSAESPFRALRIMKSFSADYLSLPFENGSVKFWQMLFPLPYKNEVFVNARARGLDPYYVAALIRQESEYNPGARSRANAYGLMQLLPSTGRMVGRQQGMRAVSTSSLLNPSVNLRLGTQYLRGQLDSWDGDWFRTLAAYNAGPSRVREWLMWSNYREPVEFMESIPFTETREYVQAVLRNADMYRELYSGAHTRELEGGEDKHAPPVKRAGLSKPITPARRTAVTASKKTLASSTKRPSAGSKKAVTARRAAHKKRDPA
jgi:soluble lytic murein transglycosylase